MVPQRFSSPPDSEQKPFLTVLQGNPTEEELTALIVVAQTVQQQVQKNENLALVLWQRQLNRGQRLGEKLRPGPGSWRRARPM